MHRSSQRDPVVEAYKLQRKHCGLDDLASMKDADLNSEAVKAKQLHSKRHNKGVQRGAVLEYMDVLGEVPRLLTIRSTGISPCPASLAHRQLAGAELWQEAEALVAATHKFSTLKQLPELKQVISATAVQVISDAGAHLYQLHATLQATGELSTAPSVTNRGDLLQAVCSSATAQDYKCRVCDDLADLIACLSPHMRLALAAEVAAGLLCPEQPPPRDTPEHAAALQLFISAAFVQLKEECHPRSKDYPIFDGVEDLLHLNLDDKVHGGSSPSDDSPTVPPTGIPTGSHSNNVCSQALAPHVDLQVQVSPQRLLQECLLLRDCLQQQQQGENQQPPVRGQSPDGPGRSSCSIDLLLRPVVKKGLYHQHQIRQAAAAGEAGHGTMAAKVLAAAVAPQHHSSQSQCQSAAAGKATVMATSASLGVAAAIDDAGTPIVCDESLVQQLTELAGSLAFGFLAQQLAAGGVESAAWQQAVPLQALQLLSAVRHVEAAGLEVVEARRSTTPAAAVRKQQQVMQLLLNLVQQVRLFQECNALLTAPATTISSSSSSSVDNSIRSSRAEQLSPTTVFGVAGPLSALSGPQQTFLGAGFWLTPADIAATTTAAATRAACSSDSNPVEPSSSAAVDCAWTVLLAAANCCEAARRVDQAMLHMLRDPFLQREALKNWLEELHMIELANNHWQSSNEPPSVRKEVEQLQDWLKAQGMIIPASSIMSCTMLAGPFALDLQGIRTTLMEHQLIPGSCEPYIRPAQQRQSCSHSSGPGCGSGCCCNSGGCGCGVFGDWDTSDGHSNSSNSGNMARHGMHATLSVSSVREAQGILSALAERAEEAVLPCLSAWHAARLIHCAKQRHTVAKTWEGPFSLRRYTAIKSAEAGTSLRKSPYGAAPGSVPVQDSRKATEVRRPSGAPRQLEDSSSSSTTTTTTHWSPGPHDSHEECHLCRAEQQEQQRRQAADASSRGSSSSSNVSCSMPVAYDDPFMWRRLLWQLLGKLSPRAQEFYFTYLAMCPHCNDARAWTLVRRSLYSCLWTPAQVDMEELALGCSTKRHTERKRIVRQYSRALNDAFVKSYHPSTTLLSKQVLLALSPLHHQVLPPPELAAFLPSSFVPGIGKALMQQLFEQPVMDGYQHEGCRLHAWHVWWHVGLRRYHALKQRQQQQSLHGDTSGTSSTGRSLSSQQTDASSSGSSAASNAKGRGPTETRGHKHTLASSDSISSSTSSTANPGIPQLSVGGLEALYLDADARLYAVGYATRQLSGRPQAAASSDSPSGLHHQLQAAALQLLQSNQVTLLKEAAALSGSPRMPQQSALGLSQEQQDFIEELVHTSEVLACGQSHLRAGLNFSRNLLTPAGQRCKYSTDTTSRPLNSICSYLTHCPIHSSSQQSKAQKKLRQQLDPSQARQKQDQNQWQDESHESDQDRDLPPWNAHQRQCRDSGLSQQVQPGMQEPSSDVSDLALLSPVPVEALIDPGFWWAWQQAVLQLDTCDVCGEQATNKAVVCAHCKSATYCSNTCRMRDQVHNKMCSKLQQAQQRYAPSSFASSHSGRGSIRGTTSNTTSGGSSGSGSSRSCGFPLLAKLLHPGVAESCSLVAETGSLGVNQIPLAFPWGRSLVSSGTFLKAAMSALTTDHERDNEELPIQGN